MLRHPWPCEPFCCLPGHPLLPQLYSYVDLLSVIHLACWELDLLLSNVNDEGCVVGGEKVEWSQGLVQVYSENHHHCQVHHSDLMMCWKEWVSGEVHEWVTNARAAVEWRYSHCLKQPRMDCPCQLECQSLQSEEQDKVGAAFDSQVFVE